MYVNVTFTEENSPTFEDVHVTTSVLDLEEGTRSVTAPQVRASVAEKPEGRAAEAEDMGEVEKTVV